MKKDQYISHEISMRSTTEVMKLIENEGMAGYGIYWANIEASVIQKIFPVSSATILAIALRNATSIFSIS